MTKAYFDEDLANHFIEAVLHTLQTVATTKAKALEAYDKQDRIARGDITCMMKLTGSMVGTVSVSFTEKCILSIVSNMFSEKMTEINHEIKDAVGEFANMISGLVTAKMLDTGKTVKTEVSYVLMGKEHEIDHIRDCPVIAIPFDTDYGDFTVEVCLVRKKSPALETDA